VELSTEQQKIFDAIVGDVETVRVQTMGGYAGTGKSTLVRELHSALPHFAVAAFTGKASHVLRQKGCEATTIHSLIYHPADNDLAKRELREWIADLCKSNAPHEEILHAMSMLNKAGKPQFVLKQRLVNDHGDDIESIIVDEASMVPENIHYDLMSFGLPLVYVGDHGQLPPVSDKDDAFNLMADPDYRLETIHRNAGPIAHFAEHLRKGGAARGFSANGNTVQVLGTSAATTDLLKSADQVICPYNSSRVEINRKIHFAIYGEHNSIEVGERIICLRNSHADGLFNGQQGTITRTDEERVAIDFEDDAGQMHVDVEVDVDQFGKEKYVYSRGGPHPFDYAYAVTCHKAQGSEWPHVLVLDQGWKNEHPKWAYTAASRARERLAWITR
jgi:exodeoxyribonuclease-5